ncbi:hypothetical protein J6590_058627 [Homalodisca vitripennis]|nr:hypothetical protein J6590_058627 [Homalodisca vitripennis]
MHLVVKYVFNATSIVYQHVMHAILRDLTTYYWDRENENFEHQNELSDTKQENCDDKTNSAALVEESENIETLDVSENDSYTKKEFGVNIEENCDVKKNVVKTLTGNEDESETVNVCMVFACVPPKEDNRDECAIHHIEENISEEAMDATTAITPSDEVATTLTSPEEIMNDEDVNDKDPRETIFGDCIQNIQEDTQETQYDKSSETQPDKGIQMPDHYPSLFQHVDKIGIYEMQAENKSDTSDVAPNKQNKEYTELELNGNSELSCGTKDNCSDTGSSCSESWMKRFLFYITPEFGTQQEDETAQVVEVCNCAQTHRCLQVVQWDEQDDVTTNYEMLTAEQLGSVETGSVSDWLYRVNPTIHLV